MDEPRVTVSQPDSAPPEPTQESVRALLRPREMLAELWWPGSDEELSLPIPHDTSNIVVPASEQHVTVTARADANGLRSTLCSILERVEMPIALSVLLHGEVTEEVLELARRVEQAVPGVHIVHGTPAAPGTHHFKEGEQVPWGSPGLTPQLLTPSVAYLLPGLPPEGSGGSHSLVQEARGLRGLGCEARICVPRDALGVATTLYGNADGLFVAYAEPEDIPHAIGPVRVAVATEYPSLSMLERLSEARPELVCAYYVQDYEPLFAAPESSRSDRALLSYRAIPGQLLFSKTHWLRNVVTALHGVSVAKVQPSLDHELFHAEGRVEEDGVVRVAAMVRPRTPRRRPVATLQALEAIRAQLGERVRTITFGCDTEAYTQVAGALDADAASEDLHGGAEHLGLLTRQQVAELMRRCDIFIDASAYQAFGRSGLEAMACGAVPVLPALGGVHEYAEHDRNAVILDDDRPAAIADAVVDLACDDARLARLRESGLRTAARFSIESAARSQLELFAAAVGRRAASATVIA